MYREPTSVITFDFCDLKGQYQGLSDFEELYLAREQS